MSPLPTTYNTGAPTLPAGLRRAETLACAVLLVLGVAASTAHAPRAVTTRAHGVYGDDRDGAGPHMARPRAVMLQDALAAALTGTPRGMPADGRGGARPDVSIALPSQTLFGPGGTVLSASGRALLDKALRALLDTGRPLVVEGHVARGPSVGEARAWRRSAAQAQAVVHHAIHRFGVPPERIALVARGDALPMGSVQNRIVLRVALPR